MCKTYSIHYRRLSMVTLFIRRKMALRNTTAVFCFRHVSADLSGRQGWPGDERVCGIGRQRHIVGHRSRTQIQESIRLAALQWVLYPRYPSSIAQ